MTEAPKRILIGLRNAATLSGATNRVMEHTRRLTALGHRVEVFAERFDLGRLGAAGGLAVRTWSLPLGSTLRRRMFARAFERHLARSRADLVLGFGDTLRQDVVTLLNCAHRAHEEIYGRPIGEDPVARIHAAILGGTRFRRCIVNSRLMRDDVVARFALAPELVRVIYPGYDPARFGAQDRERQRAEMRRRLGLGAGDVLAGLITSGDFRKRGLDILIEAMARLAPAARDRLRLLVVGKERRLQPYREQAQRLGVADRLLVAPQAADVERYFHALDICVHPARFEEFGMVVLEAMAAGVSIVTTRLVGAAELFGPEGQAMVLDRPLAGPLAAILSGLVLQPELRARWAELARQASIGHTWDDNFRETLEVYRALGL